MSNEGIHPIGEVLKARRRSRGFWLIVSAAAVLCLGGLAWILGLVGGSDNPLIADGQLTYTVSRSELLIAFTERGNVKSAKVTPIYSRLEGEHTIVSLVPEGTTVQEGDVLVELDASEITTTINQQQILVDQASAASKQAVEQYEIQKSLGESEVQTAELALELANLDLEKYMSVGGDRDLARQKAQADVEIARKERDRAQTKFEWTDKLAKKGYVTGTELLADQLSYDKADLALTQAEGALKLLTYTEKKDYAKYKSAVDEAVQALARTKRKVAAMLEKEHADKIAKLSTLELSEKRLAKLRDQLEKTRIIAPQGGMVVYPNVEPWRRDRMIMQGSQVHENQRLMDLPDVSTMAVDVQVHEAWVDQVKPGLTALVSIDALPNLKLRGQVTKVGILPDSVNRWLNPDLKVYQTEITLEDHPDVAFLKPGMSAKVQIVVDVLKDALFVPVQSLTYVKKERVCYVRDGRVFAPRPVKVGRYNDSFIEVKEGLQEQDVVLLNAPRPTGGSQKDALQESQDLIDQAEEGGGPRGDSTAALPPGRDGEPAQAGDDAPGSGRRRRGGAQDADTGPGGLSASEGRPRGRSPGEGGAGRGRGTASDAGGEGPRGQGARPERPVGKDIGDGARSRGRSTGGG